MKVYPKSLYVREEEWINESESSDDEVVNKCLVATEQPSSCKSDLAQAASDSKHSGWSVSSLYQVSKFSSYSESEKIYMFNCLKCDLQETKIAYRAGKSKITELEQKLVETKKNV